MNQIGQHLLGLLAMLPDVSYFFELSVLSYDKGQELGFQGFIDLVLSEVLHLSKLPQYFHRNNL